MNIYVDKNKTKEFCCPYCNSKEFSKGNIQGEWICNNCKLDIADNTYHRPTIEYSEYKSKCLEYFIHEINYDYFNNIEYFKNIFGMETIIASKYNIANIPQSGFIPNQPRYVHCYNNSSNTIQYEEVFNYIDDDNMINRAHQLEKRYDYVLISDVNNQNFYYFTPKNNHVL